MKTAVVPQPPMQRPAQSNAVAAGMLIDGGAAGCLLAGLSTNTEVRTLAALQQLGGSYEWQGESISLACMASRSRRAPGSKNMM
mmetsp:Transcript_19201/g.32114  ORF Transcript_19201/g.32114 Transcript_19201/m.32114 type:complete len:84 (+) Transcript_19201:95-346(+)